jgi:putative peptidoglycan lipid II flippase
MAQSGGTQSAPHSSTPDNIAHAAGLAGVATLTSRILGLVRDQVLAALFGAGDAMDAFLVAFRIPNLVRDLFAEGAMSAAFVPTFTRQLTLRGKDDAWRLGNSVVNALVLITGAAVAIGYVFATPLVSLYAEGFAAVPGKLELTVRLARVMMPFLTCVAVAAALMGMLNSLRHYFVPALAPAMFNVVSIVFAIVLTPLMPRFGLPPIMSIAIGALVGGIAQVAIQWPPLRREGFRYEPVVDRADPALHRVLVLMGPGTIGLAATQLNLFVSTYLAAQQGTGAVSWLQYAFRVMYLPLGLFGVSIATAVLPAAARHAAAEDRAAIRSTVSRGLALMLMVNVPATCGLILLSSEIIRLLFERGHFTPADTAATAAALRLYAAGLVGYSTSRIASPVFYALGRSRVPVALSTISVLVNLTLSLLLVGRFGFEGLAAATSMAALVNAALCLAVLRFQLGGIGGARLALAFAKVAGASLFMSATVVVVNRALYQIASSGSVVTQAATLLGAIASGILALAVAARVLRIEEFSSITNEVIRRVQKLLAR